MCRSVSGSEVRGLGKGPKLDFELTVAVWIGACFTDGFASSSDLTSQIQKPPTSSFDSNHNNSAAATLELPGMDGPRPVR